MAKEINLFEKDIQEETEKGLFSDSPAKQPILPRMNDNLEATQQKHQLDKLTDQYAKRIIEALLFSSCEPLSLGKIKDIIDKFLPLKPRQLRALLLELQHDYLYHQRAFRLEEIAEGFLLRTCEEYSAYIAELYRNKRTEKLSQASAEVLAIIAYRQPVTRQQIESIRGVDSSGIVQNLLERQLIQTVGKLEVVGRPTLYGITSDFLRHFGLRDLHELPTLPEK